ncbi:MAG: XisH family protein [Coleofasciculus sp. C1-SOL-03]|jgi:hypothetical protein|uniref:XisH family protein n=1 Tax=Coleofasciculus sp. C1-SOL-03 TaxID=3069522 RepID=UPI0032F8CD94
MPAKDVYHNAVKTALVKDGWTITADPYTIKFEELQLFADLGAGRTVIAQRNQQEIIVEIKSFIGRSLIHDLQNALGQYIIYRTLLSVTNPTYKVYLAINQEIYENFFSQVAIQFIIQHNQVALLVVNIDAEEVIQWIS